MMPEASHVYKNKMLIGFFDSGWSRESSGFFFTKLRIQILGFRKAVNRSTLRFCYFFSFTCNMQVIKLTLSPWPGGETGRHVRLRGVCRKTCEFESRPGHYSDNICKNKKTVLKIFSAPFLYSKTVLLLTQIKAFQKLSCIISFNKIFVFH